MSPLGFTHLPNRSLLRLEGKDTIAFLQNIVTCNLDKLSEKQACYGALLTPQGKYLFDFFLFADPTGLWLDTESERAPLLEKRLTMYKLRADVKISSAPAGIGVFAGFGPQLPEKVGLENRAGAAINIDGTVLAVDPRHAAVGLRAVGSEEAVRKTFIGNDIPEVSYSTYDHLRLTLGLPDSSRDIQVEKSTVLEANFEPLNGVDFKKGCYVGQEVTARTKYRGLLRKRLLPVNITGPVPEPGTDISFDGRNAGTLFSAQANVGMALIRLEHWQKAKAGGASLTAGDATIEPYYPAWLPAEE